MSQIKWSSYECCTQPATSPQSWAASWTTWNLAMLPDDPTVYDGMAWAFWFTVVLTVVMTVRSLIHIFRSDGGAQSIAGIDVTVEGGRNTVAIFAQWGLMQLLMAVVAWIAIARYEGLIPLILLLALIENVGRIAIGLYKPLKTSHVPPGARGSRILAPILVAALVCSLI